MDWSTVIDILAYASGLFFSICLIPQLQLMWQNRSASDVSFSWTLLFIVGLLFQITYLALLGGYIWSSVVPELSLALGVLWSKFYLDNLNAQEYLELKQSPSVYQSTISSSSSQLRYRGIASRHQLSKQLMEVIEEEIHEQNLAIHFKHVTTTTHFHAFSVLFTFELNGHVIAHFDGVSGLCIDVLLLDQPKATSNLCKAIDQTLMEQFPELSKE